MEDSRPAASPADAGGCICPQPGSRAAPEFVNLQPPIVLQSGVAVRVCPVLECGDSSPLAAIDLPRHRAACRLLISGRLRAQHEIGLWYSRQQAAWSGQRDDLQSGDQSPHSRGAFGAVLCAVKIPGCEKPCGIGRDPRAPFE